MKLYTLDNEFIGEREILYNNFTGIVVISDGTKRWLVDGKLHRIDGPAAEYINGTRAWHINGKYHRLDGPAYVHCNGLKEWHFEGEYHRIDGPAVEYPDGEKLWYINGKQVTELQCKFLCDIMKLKGLL